MRRLLVFTSVFLIAVPVFAQEIILYSSRNTELNTRSTIRTSSAIEIDSFQIRIQMGESSMTFPISKRLRDEDATIFSVLDINDEAAVAVFQPSTMTFDYKDKEYWYRFFIDSIWKKEVPVDTLLLKTDSIEAEMMDTLETIADTIDEDKTIYTTVAIMPEFPGGKEAMNAWLATNVKYPAEAKKNSLVGLVEIAAVIEKDGTITDVKIKRDIGSGCGAEAMKAVLRMPQWLPGEDEEEYKRVRVVIPVFFPPGK